MFTDPIKNLKAFGLREDYIVADLGAGTGYYSIPAGALLSRGKVYAVEIIPEFLTTIKNKAQDANLNNVEILWGNIEKIGGTKIADGILDAVIASNVLFQVEDKERFIEEIRRILKPEGRVLLIEWSVDSPLSSPLLGRKKAIPQKTAREMFEKKGFKVGRDINTGEHHYGMILAKE